MTDSRTRDQIRSARPRDVRAKTVTLNRLTQRQLREERRSAIEATHEHPKTRGECANGPRPCPLVGCKHHLYLDVSEKTGSIKLNFPDFQPWELKESCALDVADDGGKTLEEVSQLTNITRERVRQLEETAFKRLPLLDVRALARDYGIRVRSADEILRERRERVVELVEQGHGVLEISRRLHMTKDMVVADIEAMAGPLEEAAE